MHVVDAHPHNGASHQDRGFIDHVMNKKAEVVRVYLSPDANTLLSVADHCLRSRNYVNVIVAGKQPAPTWLDMDDAPLHCERGLGIWDWASNDGGDPDVVLAAAGDVPTLEIRGPTDLRRHIPDLKVRVVNVVDPDLIDRTPGLARRAAVLRQQMVDKRAEHHAYARSTGEDLPEVRNWTWPAA